MLGFGLACAVCAGLSMAFQSPTNATLSRDVGNAEATLVSFTGGTLLLLVLSLTVGTGDLTEISTVPFWQLIGGLYGVVIVLTITYATPVLGVALTLTVIMLGQLSMGMIIDANGLLLSQRISVTPLRLLGIIVVAVGILSVYLANVRTGNAPTASAGEAPPRRKMAVLVGVSFLAGVGGALQAPTNAALATTVGQLESSLVSFAGGTVLIFLYTLVTTRGHFVTLKKSSPWKLIGGFYGAANVFLVIVATPYLGVSLLMVCLMLGQLGAGLLIDARGWFQSRRIHISLWRIVGVVLIVAGVVLVALAKAGS